MLAITAFPIGKSQVKPSEELVLARGGLLVSDSLKNGNLTKELFERFSDQYNKVWTLYGSAIKSKTPVDVHESTSEGLSLGIKAGLKQEIGLVTLQCLETIMHHFTIVI